MNAPRQAGGVAHLSPAEVVGMINDTLPPDELTRIEAHLETCDECRQAMDTHKAGCSVAAKQENNYAATLDAPSPVAPGTQSPTFTLDDFTDLVVRSGLMTGDELHSFISDSLPPDTQLQNGEQLARALANANKLTPFQLERLRERKPEGLVLGNYVLQAKLGAGGMGVVFKARHRRMKRDVALKVLPEALTRSPDAVARFHREVEAAARLQHPNIAAAYDADEAAGAHFLVMEFVDGPDLSRYVKQHGPVPLAHALALCIQAARGLAHAHKLGVVHRDIKPGNLLVDSHGTLKILDMGLAHLQTEPGTDGVDLTELTQSGRVMGTVDYMAPEQAVDAKRADHRADIYSLGCTLYYLVTGRPLSPEGSITQKLLWHQNEAIVAFSSVCPASTPSLDAALAALLAKRPEDRPQSMTDVVRSLEACLAEITAGGRELPPALPGPLAAVDLSPSMYSSTLGGRTTFAEIHGATTMTAPAPTAAPSRNKLWIAAAVAGALGLGGIVLAVAAAKRGKEPTTATASGAPTTPDASPDGPPAPPVPLPPAANNNAAPATPDTAGVDAAKVAPAPPPEPTPEEKALDRIFALAGSVSVATQEGTAPKAISRREDLPAPPFQVRGVKLDRAAVDAGVISMLDPQGSVQSLSLAEATVRDGDLAALAGLKSLNTLNLSKTTIGDSGAVSLGRLTALTDLNLAGTRITSAGLRSLTPLRSLDRLVLADTAIDDKAVSDLKSLSALRYLVLSGTRISADGFNALASSNPDLEIIWDGPDAERQVARKLMEKGAVLQVQTLAAAGAAAEPVEVRRTVDLPDGRFAVVGADLSGHSTIGDAEMKLISRLGSLARLNLDGTAVTAAGLLSLKPLGTLTKLDLGSLQVSKTATTQLAQALPKCEIKHDATDQRGTAKWIISNGGSVSVSTPEGESLANLTDAAMLPQGPFDLREVALNDKPSVADADLAKFRGLAQLERLDLSGSGVTDAGLPQLAGCARLRRLNLSRAKITPASASTLSGLKSLRELYLAGTPIDGNALRQFVPLAELSHLALAQSAVTNNDLAHLRGLPRLVWLSLDGTKIDYGALEHLRELKSLQELGIVGTAISDAGGEQLRLALPSCKLRANPPDPQRLAAQFALAHGGSVTIDEAGTPRVLQRLAALPGGACRVAAIDLSSGRAMDGESLKPLAACKDLTSLSLAGAPVTDDELANIAGLTALRKLTLSKTRVTDAGLAHLQKLANLESLDLGSTRVTGSGFANLAGLANLKHVYADHCRLTDASLKSLAEHPALESLVLSYNTLLTDRGLAGLKELKPLKRLDLAGTGATDALAEQIGKYEQLTRLDLGGTKVSDQLLSQLANHKKLEKLFLHSTRVTDGGVSSLSQVRTLKQLDVGQTEVTQSAADQLKQSIPGLDVDVSTKRQERRNGGQ